MPLFFYHVARDSAFDYPFHPVGQFRTIFAGHLRCQTGSRSTKLSLSVSSGSYCPSAIFGSRVYGYPIATLFTHYPIVWTVKSSAVGNNIGCALARVTIARDSESDYPFYPVGQCRRTCAGH